MSGMRAAVDQVQAAADRLGLSAELTATIPAGLTGEGTVLAVGMPEAGGVRLVLDRSVWVRKSGRLSPVANHTGAALIGVDELTAAERSGGIDVLVRAAYAGIAGQFPTLSKEESP